MDGYDEIGWNELSDWETLMVSTPYTCPYDGFICFGASGNSGNNSTYYVNDIAVASIYANPASNGVLPIPVKKGDVVKGSTISIPTSVATVARWYKKRTY